MPPSKDTIDKNYFRQKSTAVADERSVFGGFPIERLVANGLGTIGRSRNGIEVSAKGTGRIVLPAE